MKKFMFLGLLAGSLVAGCTAAQLAKVQTAGQLFCAKATADGPLVVAVVDTLGAPVVVTNVASAIVAAACKAWDSAAVPVSPPTGTVPTVAIVSPTT